jgi:hypothetical protein
VWGATGWSCDVALVPNAGAAGAMVAAAITAAITAAMDAASDRNVAPPSSEKWAVAWST